MKKCPNKAECIYGWAGKLMKACQQHGRAMQMIGKAIGLDLEVRTLPPNNDKCMHLDDLEEIKKN